jgi:DNA ligase (NAD+)
LGFLKDVPGIYRLPFEQIKTLEGFGAKSITNLDAAINASKEQPLHRLIFALGIRYVGETTAKTLAHAVKHLLDLGQFSLEDLLALEDIGPKVANSVIQFFDNNDNKIMLKDLEELGLKLKNDKKDFVESGNLSGQTFLFTGTLPTLKRSEAEALVETNGGKLQGSVSSKLSYLVAGDDAGSKLEKAKKINSIKIISEAEFLQLVNR